MTARQLHERADGRIGRSPVRYAAAFAAVRIALGVYWLYEQHWKLPPDFGLHDSRGLMFAFQQSIQHPTLQVYRAFLQDVVVPHFRVFGWVLGFTEVAIGLSLVLGALTRAGALLSVLQSANLLLAQARTPDGPWIYLAMLAASLFVLFTASNRRCSVDRWLVPRAVATRSSTALLTRVWMWAVS